VLKVYWVELEEMLKIKELGMRGEKHIVLIQDKDGRNFTTSAEISNVEFDGCNNMRPSSIKTAKADHSFQATLERLQNVGKKLEAWLAEEIAAQQFSNRSSRKASLSATQSFQSTDDNILGTAVSNGHASEESLVPTPFVPYNTQFSAGNYTVRRSSMSHGISSDFQLPREDENTARCDIFTSEISCPE
jgi:hypothetical protein